MARLDTGGRVPVLHLEGVETRESAEALAGRYLEGSSQSLHDGAYFWDDLIGLRVRTSAGEDLGELVEIFRAGGNEVYRVVGPGGERLVPALRRMITSIDLEARVMVVVDEEPDEVG